MPLYFILTGGITIVNYLAAKGKEVGLLLNFDGLAKSTHICHSRGGGNPKHLEITGFPFSGE